MNKGVSRDVLHTSLTTFLSKIRQSREYRFYNRDSHADRAMLCALAVTQRVTLPLCLCLRLDKQGGLMSTCHSERSIAKCLY